MKTADKGARLGNFLVDSLVFILVLFIHLIVILILFPAAFDEHLELLGIYVVTIYFFYYFFFEYILRMTPRAVCYKKQGDRCETAKAEIEKCARPKHLPSAPVDGFSYVFGLTGFYDHVSGTIVVKK